MGRMAMPVHFSGNGTLQKIYRYHQPYFAFYFHQDTFDARKRPTFDQHGLPHLHIWIGSDQQSRFHHAADPFHLGVGNVAPAFCQIQPRPLPRAP